MTDGQDHVLSQADALTKNRGQKTVTQVSYHGKKTYTEFIYFFGTENNTSVPQKYTSQTKYFSD